MSKEGRIQLTEVDEEKEGRWKQEEDDQKGAQTSSGRRKGKNRYINSDSAEMQSRSVG